MSVNSLDEYWVPEHVKEYLRRLGFVLPLDDMEPWIRSWDDWMGARGDFYDMCFHDTPSLRLVSPAPCCRRGSPWQRRRPTSRRLCPCRPLFPARRVEDKRLLFGFVPIRGRKAIMCNVIQAKGDRRSP